MDTKPEISAPMGKVEQNLDREHRDLAKLAKSIGFDRSEVDRLKRLYPKTERNSDDE